MEVNELKEHSQIKESVITLLGEAKDIFTTHFGETKEENIKAFNELSVKTKEGRFSIIVVGEFSAGKSTFLNALMREKYLDSFSSETTANINFLKSVNDSPSGKPMIRINYKDGNCETSDDVSFENIQKYVSTKGEKDVAAKIESVEIFLDSPFLNDGVDLVDSPGLNGVKELHADITKNQMKASHAAIFMFRATQPGSKSDFQTLIDLKKSCKSIIVVLNRIDEAAKQGEETVDDIVNKLKNSFKEMFPNEKIPEVWPISAYKALVARSKMELDYNERTKHTDEEKRHYLETSLIEPFEHRLLRYITKGEKAKNELLSPIEKVISVADETIQELNIEKETLNGKFSTDEINDQIDAVQTEIKGVKDTISHKKDDVVNAVADAIRNARNSITSDTKDLKDQTLLCLDNETALSDLESNVQLYVSRIKSKYQSVYSDALSMLETEFRNAIRRNLEGSVAIINKQLSSVCDSENSLLFKAVEIDTSHFNADLDLSKYDLDIASKQEERKNVLESQYKAEDAQYDCDTIKARIVKVENTMQEANAQYTTEKTTMQDPGVTIRKEWREREVRTTKRSIFNPMRWFGSKWKTEMQQYQEDVPDYTAHNFYVQQKAELEKQHQERMHELEMKREKLENQMSEFERNARNARKFQIEREDLERQIEELQAERTKKVDKAIENQLKKAKVYIEGIFESLEKDSRSQALKSINEKEDQLTQLAIDILESEIGEELETKTKKLEALKSKMTLAEQDKNDRLMKIDEAHSALIGLLEKAEAVRAAIDSIETDIIKEQ
ncbi:MAG: dynamin family protein [Bacteroidaceae bacterium]|nr:dynamin family protein [Bacteroidaceae bacterium]